MAGYKKVTIRIAHISIMFSVGRMVGVKRKLQDMADVANSGNIPIDFFLLNREEEGGLGALKLVRIDSSIRFGTGIKIRLFKYHYLNCFVPIDQYDAVILRYHYSDPSMPSFMRVNGKKVFFEHHTNELDEIWKSGLIWPVKVLQFGLEKLIAPSCMRRAAGLIAVTPGFLSHQIERLKLPDSMPTLVLPNGGGFRAPQNPLLPVVGELKLVFVSDRFRPWHGLERLLRSLRVYSGKKVIWLNIVGILCDEQRILVEAFNEKNVRITAHGQVAHDDLTKVLSGAHLGVDSLACFKLGMSESSTLKVKLYVEHGLPWVASVPDADVGRDDCQCFCVPNTNELINLESVVKWRSDLDLEQASLALNATREAMSWDRKLKLLARWVKQVQEA